MEEDAKDDGQKTEAARNLEANLDQIEAFMDRMQSRAVFDDIQRVGNAVKKISESAGKADTAGAQAAMDELKEAANDFSKGVNSYVGFMVPASRWMTVMLTTFLDTYFEDGLI